MIEPGAWLGLLGGGQLGRMFTMAAQSMGYRVVVLDPGDHSPAGSVADAHIAADYLDQTGLESLAARCAAVTTEFENVPAESLRYLARHCVVSPAADSVAVAQDRIAEKQFLASAGLEVGPYKAIRSVEDLREGVAHLLPGILKRSRLGYDGKGQERVNRSEDLAPAFARLGGEPCVLEQLLPLQLELSCVVARDSDATVVDFPVAENEHAGGILDVSIVPARVPAHLRDAARAGARSVAAKLDYCGVLCVEFFVLRDGRLLANEIAPRPAQQRALHHRRLLHLAVRAAGARAVWHAAWRHRLALPRGDGQPAGRLVAPAVSRAGSTCCDTRAPSCTCTASSEARPGRKMGHYTVLGDSVEDALGVALGIRERLRADAVSPAARTA